jgi:hypothetical protein
VPVQCLSSNHGKGFGGRVKSRLRAVFRSLCLQTSSAVKDVRKFQDYSLGVTLDLISYKGILSGMVALRKRTRRMARQDFKQDHWLLHVAFGLCLVALAIWLVGSVRRLRNCRLKPCLNAN